MTGTSPRPNSGCREEKERIRRCVIRRGLTGAANDVKWGRLLDAMRQRCGWRPSYRYKCVDGPASDWDTEWWYHLPFPMVSVEWFDISVIEAGKRSNGNAEQFVDHSAWIEEILREANFCYDIVGQVIRLHGYLPKSFDGLDADAR